MSRIGKHPVPLKKGAQTQYSNRLFSVKGPKGELSLDIPEKVDLVIDDQEIRVEADYQNDQQAKTLMGTIRSRVFNMVHGVTEGFVKQLDLVGVGYRAQISGKNINLSLGFSHPVKFVLPEGVSGKMQGNAIILESCDKQLIGEIAARLRRLRPPEPYKGKGVIPSDEVVRRKAGKSGKK